MRIVPAVAVLALLAAACGGGEGAPTTTTTTAATTTAASSTTTTAGTTTTTTTTLPPTTTTTTLPPPEVAWGEPQSLILMLPSFVVGRGQIIDAQVRVVASWGDEAYLLTGVDVSGRVHDLGGVTQTDHYSDVGVWSSPDGAAWTEQAGLPFPGSFDEWAHAAAPFGDQLVVVGAWRESGTNPTQVQNIWTFNTDDLDATAWVGAGAPPAWTGADPADLGGDREEEMVDVVPLGDRLVAVGNSDIIPEFGVAARPEYGGAVWVSADGLSWERVADEAGVFSGPDITTGMSAAVGDGSTVWAFGVDRSSRTDILAVWATIDGTDWERLEITGEEISSRQSLAVEDAARSDAATVVVGSEFGDDGRFPTIWYSLDGLSWERADLGDAVPGDLLGVAATEFGFIAVGYTRPNGAAAPLVLLSGDGRTWYEGTSEAFTVDGATRLSLTAVGVHRGMVVVAGVANYIDDYRDVLVWSGPIGPSGG